jgi:N utilization substance protein A
MINISDFFVRWIQTIFARMNADLLAVLEFWEREKGISRDVLLAAVLEAVLSAAKKSRWSGARIARGH